MRLDRPLIQLPLRVDAARLAAEIGAIEEAEWREHPEGEPGNTALPLVAAGGDPTNDSTKGPMRPTPVLKQLPYTRQVLASLSTTIGRTRFMRIANETELRAHVDTNYYWWHHLRVHVPVVTTPDVEFDVGGETVHMAPGDVWVFDTWRRHRVMNPANAPRIHLVIDTVGSGELWEMIANPDREPCAIEFSTEATPLLPIETVNHPVVMAPAEMSATFEALLDELEGIDADAAARARTVLDPFCRDWTGVFARFGTAPQGFEHYGVLIARATAALGGAVGAVELANGIAFTWAAQQLVFGVAVNPELAMMVAAPSVPRAQPRQRSAPPTQHEILHAHLAGPPRIDAPIFVVSPPRSGSTLLFETLARAPGLFTIGGESHRLIEGIAALTPAAHDWVSNRLDASDATEGVVAHLKDAFVMQLRDRHGRRPLGGPTRLLEKTPKNALRVPFLAAAFPDARFVYLYRDPRETLSSMLDAWRSGRFVTYPELPGWGGPPWSMVLTPGWRDLDGRPLAEIVAAQWATTTAQLLDDLQALDSNRWCVSSYDRLLADARAEVGRICAFVDVEYDDNLDDPLPESRNTLDSPHPLKWRRNADELAPVLEGITETAERARQVFAEPPRVEPVVVAPMPSANQPPPAPAVGGMASPTGRAGDELVTCEYSASFAALLRAAGSSLAISTYQTGRLMLVRDAGDALNTHFRTLPMPMGLAFDGRRLAVGTKSDVTVFQNQPALGARLDPPDRHDACFVLRTRYATGDIRIHDLAWADDTLWVVNTRFSCLCTLDDEHSFVPRWRPPFVSALTPEDRCHLNGLAVVDGRPKYATALGISDEPDGWREHKATSGVLIDIDSDETLAVGLSMPHSPRWHDGRLWVLESGLGALCTVDPETGAVERVGQVPGFARGLAFAGQYAIVGLSRVREHVFDGLPLTRNRTEELRCGVWVVDTLTGETAAHLAFDGVVQEIFEVSLLTGMRFPELVEPGAPLADGAYVLPDAALTQAPQAPEN